MKNIINSWKRLDNGRKFIFIGVPVCTLIEIYRAVPHMGVASAVRENTPFLILTVFVLLFTMSLPHSN